jgi:hypothetical protein
VNGAPVSPEGEPASDRGGAHGVASPEVLRRLGWLAAAWGVTAGAALGAWGGWRRGLVLTAAAALSIVALRSLEGVVRRLRVPADGATPDGLGVGYVLRLFLLAALVTLLALGGRDPLALILGLSAVPLALLCEALVQVVALSGKRKP